MKRPPVPVRWSQKRQRRREAMEEAVERGLVPEVISDIRIANAALYAEERGRRAQLRESAERIEGLIAGLSGIGLGPYGQVELKAYQTALSVVKALYYTPPLVEQSRWIGDRLRGR